jgi:FkbM family methyltransferase
MLIDIANHIKTPIKGIIQVGAHKGGELEYISKLSSNILLFEPQKDIFKELIEKLKPGMIAENFALGAVSEKNVKMFKEKNNQSQSSSLLEPSIHLKQYPSIKFDDVEYVDIITLDEYKNTSDYNLMLIDVQGFELEVLKGAKRTLENIDYILCEVNRAEVYKGCPDVTEIDSFLSTFGFKRVETNWAGWTWGDAFYSKI